MSPSRPGKGSIRNVVVVAKVEEARIAAKLADWLEERKIGVRLDSETAAALGRDDGVPRDDLPSDVDLVIVAGGDGTLLSVARASSPTHSSVQDSFFATFRRFRPHPD